MSKLTLFNSKWLDHDAFGEFASWVHEVPDKKNSAYCKFCKKEISLGNIGKRALLSHMKSKSHTAYTTLSHTQKSMKDFVERKQEKIAPSTSGAEEQKSTPSYKHVEIQSLVLQKEDTLRAEILWVLKLVDSKMSLNSCSNIGVIFRMMFHDSPIVEKFSLGRTKCSYIINHGLYPYFQDILEKRLEECDDIVVCFDESLNKVVQKGQMDLFVRYFNEKTNRVITQYLSSSFLNHAKASDLLDNFKKILKPSNCLKLLQVSMDGPNVNLSFLKKLEDERNETSTNTKQLVNLGVCGLHVMNNAVKAGLTKANWDVHAFLRDLYYIFKDSPARRGDYIAITGCKLFPQKHCTVRWLENVSCLQRALEVIDNIKLYFEQTKLPQSKPISHVKKAISDDPLLKCKLSFFKYIASLCEPFLRRFQSQKPLVPFLHNDLFELIRTLMGMFVKKSVAISGLTAKKLIEINLDNEENLISVDRVDLGFATLKQLKESKVSQGQVLHFRADCKKFVTACVKKLQEKSPLRSKMVRAAMCLDPCILKENSSSCMTKMKILIEEFYNAGRIPDNVADKARRQFATFLDNLDTKISFKEKLDNFLSLQLDVVGLDEFYYNLIGQKEEFADLWKVIKLVMILSHGNASVESGFSINKSILTENMKEHSIMAQRRVDDEIKYEGGTEKMVITQKMLHSVRSSRQRYEEHLSRKKESENVHDLNTSKRRKIEKDLKELEKEKKEIFLMNQLKQDEITVRIQNIEKMKHYLL